MQICIINTYIYTHAHTHTHTHSLSLSLSFSLSLSLSLLHTHTHTNGTMMGAPKACATIEVNAMVWPDRIARYMAIKYCLQGTGSCVGRERRKEGNDAVTEKICVGLCMCVCNSVRNRSPKNRKQASRVKCKEKSSAPPQSVEDHVTT